jgi:hypothetical protein
MCREMYTAAITTAPSFSETLIALVMGFPLRAATRRTSAHRMETVSGFRNVLPISL